MAYDVARSTTVLFGGQESYGTVGLNADTWELSFPVVYVNHAAIGTNDGNSWDNAFTELRVALAYAATHPGVHEIWVAAGTYTPAGLNGSRSASFNLQNNLAIYGGFSGTETELSQRNIAANPTILSGDLNGDDTGDLNFNDNSAHVVTIEAGIVNTAIDGFTVTAGVGQSPEPGGAGLLARGPGSVFSVRNCRFTRHREGTALLILSALHAIVESCDFDHNLCSGSGGALLINDNGRPGGSPIDPTPTIRGCTFADNRAEGSGDYGNGGAAYVIGDFNTAFIDCLFVRNIAANSGGAVCASAPPGSRRVAIINTSFLGNAAGMDGGACAGLFGGTFDFVGCAFTGNVAARQGGACNFSNVVSPSKVNRVVSSTFAFNAASAGGALFGADTPSGNTLLANSTFRLNFSNDQDAERRQVEFGTSSPDIRWCSIDGWSGSLGGIGNDGLDPQFLRLPSPGLDNMWGTDDDDFGDLRLSPGSPAIDSGDSSVVPQDTYDIDVDGNTTEALPLDLIGFPRFVDDPSLANTGPGSPPVDRGCYESQVDCTSCSGVREWRSPLGGGFNYAGNWYPSIPGPTHDTIFDLAATFDVTFPTAAQLSANSANIRRGDVLFVLGASTWSLTSSLSPALQIGSDSPTLASLTITGGTLQAFSALIGTEPNSQGNLHLTGPGSTLRVTNDTSIGFFGKGTALIDNGGRLITRTAGVGDQPGSDGSFVRVTGPGSRWDVPFFLQINNGEVNVSNQATLNAGFGIFLFQNGVLSGDGTINGDVINFGSLRPGNSPGRLTINGSYEQVGVLPDLGASSGQLVSEIAGTPASGNYDKLTINGTANLGGLLQVKLIGH
ncbi:MAG: hypothetical protein AABZ53_06165, partial [Planctomycetota bacterium]